MKILVRTIGVFVTLTMALSIVSTSHAQTQPREEEFVYATTFFDGLAYSSAMTPPDVDTIYMIADVQNILAPRRTMIYYWPITNRYLADWDLLNEIVEGELEVYQGDELFTSIPLQDYVIQYDGNNPLETLTIGLGEEALSLRADFEEKFDAYRQALFDYYDAEQQYRAELDSILANNEPGTVDPADLPARPEPLPDFSLQSTEPNKAYPINLPVGQYSLLMRDENGIPVANSRRNLVVYSLEQTGIAYSVVPQSRWTRPEDSVFPNGVIYAVPGSTLYLQPSRESLYNELYYTRMLDPQDQVAREDRTKWVLHDPYPNATLRVRGSDGSVQQFEPGAYFVQQLQGSGLGYEVIEFDPESMPRPSFEGFSLSLNPENPTYVVELIDENGQAIAGSQREIRILNTERGGQVYALGLLPLVVGAIVYVSRRRQVSAVDAHAAE
ncbi:MAG: hypothetical protein DWQ07_10825 [Chloroflexi bacterium]|nr:MAG: hypothetical protein DWQ07_10825 [Chloroflexota bacterium]MBL1192793.1 hypothetical protein [Chloroflexota bacterium]NOH10087.1 hypothetical protein [Chloroflexota bacterium]